MVWTGVTNGSQDHWSQCGGHDGARTGPECHGRACAVLNCQNSSPVSQLGGHQLGVYERFLVWEGQRTSKGMLREYNQTNTNCKVILQGSRARLLINVRYSGEATGVGICSLVTLAGHKHSPCTPLSWRWLVSPGCSECSRFKGLSGPCGLPSALSCVHPSDRRSALPRWHTVSSPVWSPEFSVRPGLLQRPREPCTSYTQTSLPTFTSSPSSQPQSMQVLT